MCARRCAHALLCVCPCVRVCAPSLCVYIHRLQKKATPPAKPAPEPVPEPTPAASEPPAGEPPTPDPVAAGMPHHGIGSAGCDPYRCRLCRCLPLFIVQFRCCVHRAITLLRVQTMRRMTVSHIHLISALAASSPAGAEGTFSAPGRKEATTACRQEAPSGRGCKACGGGKTCLDAGA